jgi:chitin disaccharide deacetylase
MSGSAYKHLILCADDFGLAPGVNLAIIDLIEAGRLNATSCMTTMPTWSTDASKLRHFTDQIQVGLHLTLTDQKSIAPMPKLAPDGQLPTLGNLLKLALTGRLDYQEIFIEIQRQYDAFCQAFGAPPDFIDGHHHVHQFPIIRNTIIDLIKINMKEDLPWIRVCWESPKRLVSRQVSVGRAFGIGLLGLDLIRRANVHGIHHNNGFTGVYDYRKKIMNGDLMSRFLHRAVDGTLMFCHPGIVDLQLIKADELTDAREVEYRFFQSARFLEILEQTGFTLLSDNW